MKRYLVLAVLPFIFACGGNSSQKDGSGADSSNVLPDDRPEALKELTKKILASPDNVDLYNQRAAYYIEQELYLEGYKDLQTAFAIDSMNPLLYVTLSDYYISQEQSSNARKALEDGLKKNPENIDINVKLAELLFLAREYEKSFTYINAALRKNKFLAKGYFLKGMNYKEMGKEKEAISGFRTAIEQNPDYYDAYMQLGLLFDEKKDKLAPQYYTSAIRVQEKNPEAWYARAMHYQTTNDLEKAKSDYHSILAFDSTYFNAWYNLGFLCYEAEKKDSAYHFFDKAIKADYKQPKGYYMRGLCMEQQNKIEQAKADYQQALKLDPSFYLALQGMERLR